jgi:hypothetical protein
LARTVVAALPRDASASVPASLLTSTIRASAVVGAGKVMALGGTSGRAAALSEGVCRTMFLTKLKLVGTCVAIAALTTAGAGVLAQQGANGVGGQPAAAAAEPQTKELFTKKAVDKRTDSLAQEKAKTAQRLANAETTRGVELAEEALKAMQALRARGEGVDERIAFDWSVRLLEAERRANPQKADQVAALAAHVNRMKTAMASMQELHSAGRATLLDNLEAEFRYNQALEWLKDAKAEKPAPENVVPGSQAGMGMPSMPGAAPGMMPMAGMMKAMASGMGGGNRANMMRPMGGPGMGMMGMGMMGGGVGGVARDVRQDEGRVEIGGFLKRIEDQDETPGTQTILKKLEELISMSFASETPLEDVLKYIKSATAGPKNAGIPIYVDPMGLKEANQTLQSTTTLDLEGVPLKTTLRLLLKQLGLAYCVKDGLLIISSVNGVLQEVKEFEGPPPPQRGGFQ